MTGSHDIVATLPAMHPGELLRGEFLVPLGLDVESVALEANRTLVARTVAEEADIGGETAMCLARLFGTMPRFWMNAQAHDEIEIARAARGSRIDRIVPIRTAA